jgi:Na+:H+ antiporter, NhaA family
MAGSHAHDLPDLPRLPRGAAARVARPFARLMAVEASSGVVLILCTLVALALANSPWRDAWNGFWSTPIALRVGSFTLEHSLVHWINDGLMAIFFFAIGLEIKRELALGELSDPRKIALPVAAAFGGAAVPALVFFLLRQGTPDARAWAVPMATDIAFVVGCMALLGRRVPHGLKILMLTLAIVDDLLAVIVIALFYASSLDVGWLLGALAGLVAVVGLNRAGVRQVGVYAVVGVFVWLCTLESGIHPTVAGAALGLLTPWRAWVDVPLAGEGLARAARAVTEPSPLTDAQRQGVLAYVERTAREARSPLDRLHGALHGWVAFAIMPVFALANAGVALDEGSALAPLPLAVAAGLVLGKPIGFLLASWLVTRGPARLPRGVGWGSMLGAGCLAGIGFTMSIFVASLSFEGAGLASAKLGVLVGSLVSAVLGMVLLALAYRPSGDAAK